VGHLQKRRVGDLPSWLFAGYWQRVVAKAAIVGAQVVSGRPKRDQTKWHFE
jgi:hypothetical protein